MTKSRARVFLISITASLVAITTGNVAADNTVLLGPQRVDYVFVPPVPDWSDCTGEFVEWVLNISEFQYVHDSGHGDKKIRHGVFSFNWTGTATGLTTGYLWETHGGGKDTFNFDLGDFTPFREVFLENAILDPVTPGAPRMKFTARVRIKDFVLEVIDFNFRCLGN